MSKISKFNKYFEVNEEGEKYLKQDITDKIVESMERCSWDKRFNYQYQLSKMSDKELEDLILRKK